MQKQTLNIIKVGGALLEDQQQRELVLNAFASLSGPKILVHGGGNRADELCLKLGIEPKKINGRRITDKRTLEVVTMVYAGLINKQIVAHLQAKACNAIGLCGADCNLIRAKKRTITELDYGFAGDIDRVNGEAIKALLNTGATPVFSAITHDQNGQLLNTNADTIAASLAISLTPFYEVQLKYCFDKKGVLMDAENENSVISELDYPTSLEYTQSGIISKGMLPKLHNGFRALQQNVDFVSLGDFNSIHENADSKHTQLCL